MSFIVLLHGHASSQVIFLTSVRSVDVEIGFDFGEAGWRGPWPLSCGASAPRPLWQATLGHRLLQLQDHAHTHNIRGCHWCHCWVWCHGGMLLLEVIHAHGMQFCKQHNSYVDV